MEGTPGLKITYAHRTDVGKVRGHNEDFVIIEVPSDRDQRHSKGILAIVADGMGGHQAGEVASERAAHLTIAGYYNAQPGDVPMRLRDAIQAANAEVYQLAQANAAQAGMGTTIVAAAVIGRKVHVANVGDSRAYLMRQNTISQITTDHSFVGEQVKAGILTKEQAKIHPQRNVITRALGSTSTVEVDTYEGDLQDGDVILLCSDGLTEHVADEMLYEVIANSPPQAAVDKLVELAKEAGGSDNISVVVLQAGPGGTGVHPVMAAQPVPLPAKPPVAPPSVAPVIAQPIARWGRLPLPWVVGGIAIALILGLALIGGGVALLGGGRGSVSDVTPSPTMEIVMPATITPGGVMATATLRGGPTATIAPTSTPRPLPMATNTPEPTPILTSTPTPSECPGNQIWSGDGCNCPPDTVWDAKKQWCAPKEDDGGGKPPPPRP